MRRKHHKKKVSLDLDYSEESEDDSMNEDYVEQKRAKAKKAKGRTPTNPKAKKGKKRLMNESDSESDSENSEVLEFKGRDEVTREHVRPSFMQRWNGEDNEIEIYASEYKEMSPMFRVYWQTKSRNMRAVVLMMFGRMEFFAFENDAILLSELFRKKLKQFSSFLMVNFWCKEVLLAKQELFERNIPVLVMNEIEDTKYREQHNLIRREVDEVITPGLHLDMEQKVHKERWFMSLYLLDQTPSVYSRLKKQSRNSGKQEPNSRKDNADSESEGETKAEKKCCVVLLDSESNKFYIEEFEVDLKLHEIRRVLNRYRPVELLTMKTNSVYVKSIIKMAKQICNPFHVEIGYSNESEKVDQTIHKFMLSCKAPFFKQLLSLSVSEKAQSTDFSMFCTVKCLDIVYEYLNNLKLKEKIFDEGIFSLSCFSREKLRPFFDSQVYENLEVFRIKNEDQDFGSKGTMIKYLNLCQTNSGKKLLIRWLNEPLTDKEAIYERQQTLKEIVEHSESNAILSLHQKLVAYEKTEKEIADVYHWVLRDKKSKAHILTGDLSFEKGYDQNKNPAIQRIKTIIKILSKLSEFQQFLEELSKFKLKAKYFQKFIKLQEFNLKTFKKVEETGEEMEQIPKIENLISNILKKVDFNEVTNYLEPMKGFCKEYDLKKSEIAKLQNQLQEQLEHWRGHFKNNKICFANVRARNEIQVPKVCLKSRKDKPKELIFSSEIASAERFTTAKTIELSAELMEKEHEMAKAYEPFMNEVLNEFCSHKFVWNQYIQAISEIDVIFSLALVSKQMVPRCLPTFCDDNESSVLEIVDGHHLGLMQVLEPEQLVRNTLKMSKLQRFLLLTGPNMGGKSTILKQTCLLAILAQIGCYVPCKSYRAIVFDQIFCRIGAADRIIEGKSTFFVELEETNRIIKQATPSSLVIIDELGRGTSTYDGMAIAEATIKYILNEIGCYTLFSTHYTPITREFFGFSEVICKKMSYEILKDAQREKPGLQSSRWGRPPEKLKFLYQLQDGIAEKSFANNVARMVGLPESIFQEADRKAADIQKSHDLAEKQWLLQKTLAQMESRKVLLQREDRELNH